MVCPKCGSAVYDNRPKKLAGTFKASAPDFKCTIKTCDWVQWPPKAGASPVQAPPPPMPPAAPQAQGAPSTARDAYLIELYWDCFDRVLAGVAQRKLSDLFKPEHISAAVSTLYIARSKA